MFQTELTGLKLAALESNKSLDLEKKEGRIDDLLRVSVCNLSFDGQRRRGHLSHYRLSCLSFYRLTVTCGDR